jgi:tRNA A37 methylthiotransferase MiaB
LTRKLYIRTFGCQMNEYDSDRMADVLAQSDGLALTSTPDDADVILFNTCSVREKAQERVFHDLGRVRALKAQRPDLIIGVGGCVASQEGAAIVERAPYVDVVFGPQTLHRLPALIRARRATGVPQVDISFPRSRSSTTCRRRRWTARRRSSRSWRDAASTARSAWSRTRGRGSVAAACPTCSPKSPISPIAACAR